MQELIVAAIVALATAYAVWHWMPVPWRRALAARFAQGARRAGMDEAQAQRMAEQLGKASGCSACDSCGSCATPGDAAAQERAVRPPEPWQKPR